MFGQKKTLGSIVSGLSTMVQDIKFFKKETIEEVKVIDREIDQKESERADKNADIERADEIIKNMAVLLGIKPKDK